MSRIKQFMADILAPLRPLDEAYIKTLLDPPLHGEFNKLRKAERLHAVAVAKDLSQVLGPMDLKESEEKALLRAALVHDLGKERRALGPLTKTWLVLFAKRVNRDRLPRFLRRAWQVYFFHPVWGEEKLRELRAFPKDEYLYDLVRYHHEPEEFKKRWPDKDRLFQLYKAADDAN